MKPKKTSAKKKVIASLRPEGASAKKKIPRPAKAVVVTAPAKAAKIPEPPLKISGAKSKVTSSKTSVARKAVVPAGKLAAKAKAAPAKVLEAIQPAAKPKQSPAAPKKKNSTPRRAIGDTKKTSPAPVPSAVKLETPKPPLPQTLSITPKPAPPAPPARKAPANIPAILREGDKSEAAVVSGPGQRYSLGPTPLIEKLDTEGELPAAYGTEHLLLAARDPHWLYAHWDLTDEQQRRYNAQSKDRHLVLRIHAKAISEKPEQEVHLHPESRHWFIHVEGAGIKYFAELGYYRSPGKWVGVATSTPTFTPPDTMSEDTSAEFATIPFELPMEKLLTLVKEAVQENVPLAEALQQIEAEYFDKLPSVFEPAGELSAPKAKGKGKPRQTKFSALAARSEWTPAQEQALAKIISMDHVRRVWMGSMEITELIRRQVVQDLAAQAAIGLAQAPGNAPTSPMTAPGAVGAEGAITSPTGKERKPEKGFWFNVNAELIIYGATEADASVTIAGRNIRLRPDGSFSYRFALPDGQYELPIVAISADQTDGRAAELVFSRSTELRGDVGAHPQDPELKRPEAASL